MCYNVSTKKISKETEKQFKSKIDPTIELPSKYYLSGFTQPLVPVISAIQPNIITAYNWGLIPDFCKTDLDAKDMQLKTLNAKSETVFTLPSFKNSIREKRCLVIVDGFYEWRTIGKQKYPYFIQYKDGETFAMGGIFNDWVNRHTGEQTHTFSIITTPANALMSKIHNDKLRMPFILPKGLEQNWLNQNLTDNEIIELMKPIANEELKAHTISKLITNKNKNQDAPEVQLAFEYPELEFMDGLDS
jgi:putative SOS response-associated peptidase YedK